MAETTDIYIKDLPLTDSYDDDDDLVIEDDEPSTRRIKAGRLAELIVSDTSKTAAEALAKAEAAQASADEAQKTADDAGTAAEKALAQADTASATADAAKTAAEDASATANAAASAAANAADAAAQAQETAAIAQETAETAQTMAETAQSTAEAAQSTAETAQTTAETAKTTADTTAATMTEVQSTVDEMGTKLGTVSDNVDSLLDNAVTNAYVDSDGFLWLTTGSEKTIGPLGPFAAAEFYRVRFWNGDELLQTVINVAPGGTAKYTGETPVSEDGKTFVGWNPVPEDVQEDMDCYAEFGEAFAFYSEDDSSLNFYAAENTPDEGEKYDGKTVSKLYTDFVSTTWSGYSSCPWYSDRSKFTSVVIDSSFKSAKPVSLAYWFYDFTACKSFEGLENIDTSAVTTLYYTFYGCSGLTSLDGLAAWDTSAVTSLYYTFSGCSGLTSLDGLAEWDTSAVTTLERTFYDCSGLTSLDGLAAWDTSAVTSLRGTFSGCSGLTSLDGLAEWDVSKVTSMGYTSDSTSSNYYGAGCFYNCIKMTNIDMSHWHTDSLTAVENMFRGCSALETIYSADDAFDVSKVTAGTHMFTGCTSLVGGAGTVYDSSNVGYSYAHIDGGEDNPGYFTEAPTDDDGDEEDKG